MSLVSGMVFSSVSIANATEVTEATEKNVNEIKSYEAEIDHIEEDSEVVITEEDSEVVINENDELIIDTEENYVIAVTEEKAGDTTSQATSVQAMTVGLFSGGNGTQQSPYLIRTANDLLMLGNYTSGRTLDADVTTLQFNNAYYAQLDDIDMNFTPDFTPIGYTQGNGFTGVYSGNGFKISNLMVNFDRVRASGIEGVGLFAFTNGAEISNVELHNANVIVSGQPRSDIGAIIGYASNTKLMLSKVYDSKVNAPAGTNVGGLIGRASGSTVVSDSFVDNVAVTGINYVGGIVGIMTDNAYIRDSYNNQGTVTGTDHVGGLFGAHDTNNSENVTVFNNYSKADVTGRNNVGGLGGSISNMGTLTKTISNNYTEGTVKGIENVGGILGSTNATAANVVGTPARMVIVDNYTYADLWGNTNVGGMVGNALYRTNISRNYVANKMEVTQNNIGGIVGSISGHYYSNYGSTYYELSTLANNLVIADIVAPSGAASNILAGATTVANSLNISNNRYGFDSTISGGTTGGFENATEIYALELSTPSWWNNVLLINETNSFDTNRLLDGVLPTVLKLGTNAEVPHQKGQTYSGTEMPTAFDVTYIMGSNTSMIMEVTTSGATVTRVDGLTLNVDYYLVGNWVIFTANYLESLEEGRHMLFISLNSGQKIQAFINVGDPAPPAFIGDIVAAIHDNNFMHGATFSYDGVEPEVLSIRNLSTDELLVKDGPIGYNIRINGGVTEISFSNTHVTNLAFNGFNNKTVDYLISFDDGSSQVVSLAIAIPLFG